jgi:signal transduction histidine kinase
MRLATKLVSLFMLLLLGVVAVDALFSIRSLGSNLRSDEQEELEHFVLTLRAFAIDCASPVEVVRMANSPDGIFSVRWVWFDAQAGAAERPRAAITAAHFTAADDVVFPEESPVPDGMLCYVSMTTAGRVGGFEVEAPRMIDDVQMSETVRAFRVAGVMLALSALAAFFMGQRLVATPLHQLVEKTRRIGRGDLSGPVSIRGGDELHDLGEALNSMCDELASSQEQLRHADRLRTVGQLAAGIAHELGTPLNVISGRAGLIASGRLEGNDLADSAATIKEESDRIAKIVREVLTFARPPAPDRATVDLRRLAEQTVDLLGTMAERASATITLDPADTPVEADVDAGQIQQVITNLAVNAIQASPEGGVITVRVVSADDECRIDVEDNGPGMEPDVIERVFEPFFTTKDVGEGTGLGLAVAYGIVREHGGRIAVESEPGRGSRFSVHLPRERGE